MKSTIALPYSKADLSLQYWQKLLGVFEQLSICPKMVYIAKKKSNILSLFFISVMHFSNGAKFSNIVFLLVLLASVDIAFASVIVPCTSVHALLLSHKPDFSVEFLNLIFLFE